MTAAASVERAPVPVIIGGSATALIVRTLAAGAWLEARPGGRLWCSDPAQLTPELRAGLAANRQAVIAALQARREPEPARTGLVPPMVPMPPMPNGTGRITGDPITALIVRTHAAGVLLRAGRGGQLLVSTTPKLPPELRRDLQRNRAAVWELVRAGERVAAEVNPDNAERCP